VIKNHAPLEWLTFSRALAALQETDPQMTTEDLLTHCVHGHCTAYIKPAGMRGFCRQAFACFDPESRGIVYGVGVHQVMNPEVFALPAVGGTDRTVLLRGDVLLTPDEDSEQFADAEWEVGDAMNMEALLFKKIDIDDLAAKFGKDDDFSSEAAEIVSPATKSKEEPDHEPPVARSRLLAIAALLELLKDKQRPIYHTQEKIRKAIQKKYPNDGAGVGDDTLKKLFADANREKRQLLKKLQMQN
jgi:hypothetical protein